MAYWSNPKGEIMSNRIDAIGISVLIAIGVAFIALMIGIAVKADKQSTDKRNTFITQCINLGGLPSTGDTNKCTKDGTVIFSSK